MERSISMESWEEMQRHGQDIADRFSSLAQGIGCMLQSHIRTSTGVCVPQVSSQQASSHQKQNWGVKLHLPWPWATQQEESPPQAQPSSSRMGFEIHKPFLCMQQSSLCELGHRLGQAGSDFVGGLVGHVAEQFHKPSSNRTAAAATPKQQSCSSTSLSSSAEMDRGTLEWQEKDEQGGIVLSAWQGSSRPDASGQAAASSADGQDGNDEFMAAVTKTSNHLHKQSSITISTTYDSRTQDIESSVVARGDLWRAEASHGGASSSNGSSPLFLLQVGPILLVRDTTLLLPIHLSKRHLLWYGFDRKSGLHSLSPAIWSKNRRWLLMSMICLNPLTCSFMDVQFPNGQMTYVAGEGVSGSAFVPVGGGLLQAHGRHPGESKISFSCKNDWGTKITPSLHLPDKSISVQLTQALAWQRSGVLLRPAIQLSVTPTFGGRNAGWRAEVVHSPREKLSLACGCSSSLEPTAFASVSIGRSKRNGEHTGSSGLVVQVETPLENLRRASFSVQLNSSVEF